MSEKVDLSVFSEDENVKKLKADEISPYLKSLYTRLGQLSDILKREEDGFIVPYLSVIRNSIGCLNLKHELQGKDMIDFTLSIDPTDSGFPTVRDFYLLEKDQQGAAEELQRYPDKKEIIEMIRDRVLKGRDPIDPQVILRRYNYFSKIAKTKLLHEYQLGRAVCSGEENRRRLYTVQWNCIERGTNIPVFYRMYLEQDNSDYALEDSSPGLLETLIYQTQYGATDLRTILYTIDRELDGIHPKLGYKYTIGPFFYPGITRNNEDLEKLLGGCESDGVLKFRIEAVASQWIKKVGNMLRRMLGTEIEKEVFGPLDDSDRRMIVPFGIKQKLGNRDETGNPCRIYGVTSEGEIID